MKKQRHTLPESWLGNSSAAKLDDRRNPKAEHAKTRMCSVMLQDQDSCRDSLSSGMLRADAAGKFPAAAQVDFEVLRIVPSGD